MRIEIKCLEGNKWNHLPIEKIKGRSILDFMMDELSPTVAAVYDEDRPIFYLSNTERHTKMMKDKGQTCFTAQDLQVLLSIEDTPLPLVAHTFPGSNVIDVRRAEKQESFG